MDRSHLEEKGHNQQGGVRLESTGETWDRQAENDMETDNREGDYGSWKVLGRAPHLVRLQTGSSPDVELFGAPRRARPPMFNRLADTSSPAIVTTKVHPRTRQSPKYVRQSALDLLRGPATCRDTRRLSSRLLRSDDEAGTLAGYDMKGPQALQVTFALSEPSTMVNGGRALHFVFKVADRTATIKFYRDILGMKVLRHEEFKEGCEAACNGPYDNRWSKTMMGYGPEDSHFVIELTYNYNVHEYVLGNDFRGISVKNKKALDNAKAQGWPVEEVGQGRSVLTAPGGYKYFVHDEEPASGKDPVQGVTLASSDLKRSIQYWNELLGLKIFSQNDSSVTLGFAEDQAKLTLEKIDSPVDHATAYGRIAFSVPEAELSPIDVLIKEHNQTILTPLVTLPTPGKADVTVIILADPDGHEICFVGDEAFRQLSQVDPESDALVDRYIQKDEERSKSS
ncbi:hypothetical protein M8J77_005339 [Diaphorina citri]|nr:hypothetical protein M8J77_005339 [Diaphorina citri]